MEEVFEENCVLVKTDLDQLKKKLGRINEDTAALADALELLNRVGEKLEKIEENLSAFTGEISERQADYTEVMGK